MIDQEISTLARKQHDLETEARRLTGTTDRATLYRLDRTGALTPDALDIVKALRAVDSNLSRTK